MSPALDFGQCSIKLFSSKNMLSLSIYVDACVVFVGGVLLYKTRSTSLGFLKSWKGRAENYSHK